MTARVTTLLAISMAIALIAVGCGGDDGEATGETITTSSLSKAEFVKKADEICARQQARARGHLIAYTSQPEHVKLSQAEQMKAITTTVFLPDFGAVVTQIRKLGAPSGDEAEVEAFLDAMEQALDEGSDAKTLPQFELPLKRPGRLAFAYGIKKCAFRR